jgi:hypothetical protein
MTNTEDQLRAMFRADAERIQPSDLRPAADFAPPRARRSGWLPATAALLATAAATAAIVLAVQPLHTPATHRTPPAAAQSPAAAMSVVFGTRTVVVTPPGATVTVPQADVYAADPAAAARVSGVLDEMINDQVTVFRNRATEDIGLGSKAQDMSAKFVVGDTVTWRRYLTVRFDSSMMTSGPHPVEESDAATFDTRTGVRVRTTDLFTDIERATTIVREAFLASRRDGSLDGYSLTGFSLQPAEDGSTSMVNCYPTAAGLHCLLDRGNLTPWAAGRVETTVPWDHLAPILRPGVAG